MKKLLSFVCMMAAAAALYADRVVASWDFTKGTMTDSVSGIQLTPRGDCRVDAGQGLLPGTLVGDKACGASTGKVIPSLAPRAFRVTMSFTFDKSAFEGDQQMHLWDSKYVNYTHQKDIPEYHHGFMLELYRIGQGIFRPRISLGYGGVSENVITGPDFHAAAGETHTLVCEYNGCGVCQFTVDGKKAKAQKLKIGRFVSAPCYPTMIGDRVMGSYHHFRGRILTAKLEEVDIPDMSVSFHSRTSFLRGEEGAALAITVHPTEPEKISDVVVAITGRDRIAEDAFRLDFKDARELTIQAPIRTNLLPGEYNCDVKVTGKLDGKPIEYKEKVTLHIGTRPSAEDQVRFFWLFGHYYYDQMRDMGMTHLLNHVGGYNFTRNTISEDAVAGRSKWMDRMLADGLVYMETSGIAQNAAFKKAFPRINKDGSKDESNADCNNPEAIEAIRKGVTAQVEGIANHPAFGGMMPASEIRDGSHPSFTSYNAKSFKDATGLDVPREVEGRTATHYTRLKDFPFGRIVSEDYPLMKYYTWFWKTGDGWNNYQGMTADIYRDAFKRPLLTFYDPSVRVPPLYGNGGSVDYLNQWTYIYPDPFNVSYVVSEQMAMARGSNQGVITMLQGISYRSKLAPKEMKVKNPPAWMAERPNTVYMTTPPDVMREGLWTIFSRKLDGIGLYAWRALFDASPYGYDKLKSDYQFTCPDTIKVAAELFRRIAIPFGPLLKSVPERKSEVAVLESYASTFFAQRGSWGWSGRIYDVGIMLTAMNLDPYVLYEEEVAKGIPEHIRVIIAPHCDVLTSTTFEMLRRFQMRGGIIIADEHFTPALLPDMTLPVFERVDKADVDKIAMHKTAAELKAMLEPFITPYVSTDNQDLLARVRTYKDADVLFVINDRRGFGDYVGQYGKLMEKGLPNSGTATVRRHVGAIYDLELHKRINAERTPEGTRVKVSFTTTDGKMFLMTSKPLSVLKLAMGRNVARGGTMELKVTSPDTGVMVPVNVVVSLPGGIRQEQSGYGIVKDGALVRQLVIPENAPAGTATVEVTNLADNSSVRGSFEIR